MPKSQKFASRVKRPVRRRRGSSDNKNKDHARRKRSSAEWGTGMILTIF